MKKLLLLGGIVLLAMSSCSKDEAAETPKADDKTVIAADFNTLSPYVVAENDQWVVTISLEEAKQLGVAENSYYKCLEAVEKENRNILRNKAEGYEVAFALPANEAATRSTYTKSETVYGLSNPSVGYTTTSGWSHKVSPSADPIFYKSIKVVLGTYADYLSDSDPSYYANPVPLYLYALIGQFFIYIDTLDASYYASSWNSSPKEYTWSIPWYSYAQETTIYTGLVIKYSGMPSNVLYTIYY